MILVYDYAATHGVEGCGDTIFGKVNGELNELSVHVFDCLVRVLDEGIFE